MAGALLKHPERKSGLCEYRLLGNSGLRVSPLCLGIMTWGNNWNSWGIHMEKDEAKKVFEHFIAQGGNFIDTAVNYQNGQSEEWLGEFMAEAGNREELVIATKFSAPAFGVPINPNHAGNGRKNLMYSVDLSLKRLKTTYIDLLYVHVWDYTTPVEELMRGLDDLVRSGKVHYIAISDTPAWVVSQAQTIAGLRGWTKFIAYQGRYNVGDRDFEADIIPMSLQMGLGGVPWSVLGAGKYTGRFLRGQEAGKGQRKVQMSEKDYDIAEELVKISKELGCTPSQVALNWTLQQPGITSALVGISKVRHLKDNIGALEKKFKLTDEHMARLTKIVAPKLPFPHNMLGGTKTSEVFWIKPAGRIVAEY